MNYYIPTISICVSNSLISASITFITLLCSLFPTITIGQSASVEFVVDMAYSPLEPNQFVAVQGRSETLGGFKGGDLKCQPDGGTLYSITIDFLSSDIGKEHYYKFVILGPDDEMLREHRAPRSITLIAGHSVLEPVFFNDINRPVLSEDLSVRFTLDMNNYGGEQPTSIGIAGTEWPLGPKAPSLLQIMNKEHGLWVTDLLFEAGTPTDITFHFYFEIDGRWKEEKHEHAVKLNNNRSTRTIAMTHNGSRIVPALRNRDLLTDDFAAIASAVGSGGARHLHNAALQHLSPGQVDKSLSLFNQFSSIYSGSDSHQLQDQYHVAYAQYLYTTGRIEEAISYLDNREVSASNLDKKAAFAHAKSAVQQAAGDFIQAVSTFGENEYNYGSEEASFGLGVSHLKIGEYQRGTKILEELESTEIRRLAALTIAGHAHADSSNLDAALATFSELGTLGTDAEQVKALLASIEIDYKQGAFSQALSSIEGLLTEPSGPLDRHRLAAKNKYRRAHLLLLKGLILNAQGQNGNAFFQEVITHFPDTKFAQRAQRNLGN